MQQEMQEQFHKKHNKKRFRLGIQFLLSLLMLAVGAVLLMYLLREYNYVISGNDAWGHIFKSNLMYQNLIEGNYYPLFTKYWYNGIQPYRYWAPLPYYILAGLQYLAGGNIASSYYLFAGLSFFTGGLGWLLWGLSSGRMKLCTFIALLWFFLPENIRVFFCEGNVPRMVTAIFIPYLLYFMWLFVEKQKRWAAFFITLFTAAIALSHLMISAMMGIAAFIFMLFYMLANKKYLRAIEVIISMLFGYVLIGIWLFPALKGGLVSMDPEASASVMKSLSYSLLTSLNPMNRINGIVDTFYYGISVVLICIMGVFLANRKEKAGFFTNIIILLCTTPALIPFLSKLPLNQLLWMMRFATIGYAFFLWSLIEWKNLRRYFVILLSLMLLIDCVPSLNIARYYTQSRGNFTSELQEAARITKQRVALMDLSSLSSYPSWELCSGDKPTQYTYGWAWQGAATAPNIVNLNTAMETGNYEYLFDRCLELGNDTVIVVKDLVSKANKSREDLISAATAVNYSLYQETNQAYIFHMDTPNTFGVITKYKGIGIGKYASQIVFPYPAFTGGSVNIEDYTIEELSKYKVIYLSGFEYNDRIHAEQMVKELSEKGIKIIIDMSHIPVVKETKRMYFLGVVAQDIEFKVAYPTLTYQDKTYDLASFPKDYENWNTKYIEGVTKVLGTGDYYGEKLDFAGTKENDNIIFLGFNLLFYSMLTDDPEAYQILNDCFDTQLHELPSRTVVPITVQYKSDKILIDTDQNTINTTIAYQDNFISEDGIKNQDNLLTVTKKHTEINLIYPYFKQGLIVSFAGFVGTLLWMLMILQLDRKKKKDIMR
jgi:Predicted integral membrane protein